MNKLFTANKYVPIALALAVFTAAGSAPVFASSQAGLLAFRLGMLSHSCISNRSTTVVITPTRGLLTTVRLDRLVLGAQTRSGLMNGLTDKGPSTSQRSAVICPESKKAESAYQVPAESIGPGIFIAVRSGRSKKAAVDWP